MIENIESEKNQNTEDEGFLFPDDLQKLFEEIGRRVIDDYRRGIRL